MVIAVMVVVLAGGLWLLDYVERPAPVFAGAGAVLVLAIAARRRAGAG